MNPACTSDPIVALRDLILRHQPSGHARMTEPAFTAKYLRVSQPITDADLAAHLAGDITLAAVLQRDDQASVAAVDIDAGGEFMIRRVMRAAEIRACHAYGFVLDSGGHSGGHVWIFFDQTHPSHDLQVLMRDIVSDAQCPTTEIYPNGADLRLPFGVHRRCNRRGTLLLTSAAAPLDLDADLPGTLAMFLHGVRRTSDLPVRVAHEAQQARRAAVAEAIAANRPRRGEGDAHWREVIAQFNESTDLVALLERYGARAAYHYAGGKVLMHCAASQDHAHGDTHASLVVEPGRGHQLGRMICGCYSPACRLHNQPGQVMDAFEVFCRLEQISKREAVQRLQRREAPPVLVPAHPHGVINPRPPLSPDHHCPPTTTVPRPPTPDAIAQRRLVDVSTDRRAQPLDRRLLAYVIAQDAQGQGIANATIAAALGAQPDSIKRAKRRLRALGYIDVVVSVDGVSPSVITIIGAEGETVWGQRVENAETGVQLAPPFHVSESTCVDATPPPESKPASPNEIPTGRSEEALRRRRSVLRNMIRTGVPERQRLALSAELDVIETQFGQPMATVEQLTLGEDGLSDEEPTTDHRPPTTDHQPPTTDHHMQIARPDDPHPPLTDAQLSAVLCDALSDTLSGASRALLDRVSWRLEGDGVTLICETRDLAPVTGQLLAATRRVLADVGLLMAVRVQIGRPTPVGVQPAWIDDALWAQVPVWARSLLVGSVVIDGRLYGATVERTADLAGRAEIVRWVVAQAQAERCARTRLPEVQCSVKMPPQRTGVTPPNVGTTARTNHETDDHYTDLG